MIVDVLTLFPGMFVGPLTESMIKRAVDAGLLSIRIHDIRDWATDKHHVCDDYPYGGGAGMVMKPEPVFAATEAVLSLPPGGSPPVVLMTPQGRVFTQSVAAEFASWPRLLLLCGHYEGVDERIRSNLVTDEISIGDYVLTGGELAAMVIVDAVARLVPGVLEPGSLGEESHGAGLLEYPQYTRPPVFRNWAVPEILLSGNHGAIAAWRRRQALQRTWQRRPDLVARLDLSAEDRRLIDGLEQGEIPSENPEQGGLL
jgi:tRNA (guanine37-N1)-methyltransferase